MIERIEVLRGPAAARYGNGAAGGVVNIITQKAAVSGTAPGTLISMHQNIKRKVPLNAPTSA